jgi:hypothetical protein
VLEIPDFALDSAREQVLALPVNFALVELVRSLAVIPDTDHAKVTVGTDASDLDVAARGERLFVAQFLGYRKVVLRGHSRVVFE